MSRIPTPAVEQAPEKSRPLLAVVQKQLGKVPNMFRIIANGPAALEAYLGFADALAKGALAPPTRERIALAVAEVNGCGYCLSAHTYLARNVARLDNAEITANRNGASNDIKADVAVRFATKLARERGQASEADIAALKHAGYLDAGDCRNHCPCRAQHIHQLPQRSAEDRDRLSRRNGPHSRPIYPTKLSKGGTWRSTSRPRTLPTP